MFPGEREGEYHDGVYEDAHFDSLDQIRKWEGDKAYVEQYAREALIEEYAQQHYMCSFMVIDEIYPDEIVPEMIANCHAYADKMLGL